MAETYGVSALAALAGVTVRTLHHYDEIGLLTPAGRSAAGYRRYDSADVARLQSILFYRELGLSLEAIAAAMSSQSRLTALEEQRRLLAVEMRRIRVMLDAVEQAIDAEKSGVKMSPEDMFEVFGDFDPAEYSAEAADAWPDVYEQSRRRTSGYGKEQWQQAVAEGDAIAAKLAALLGAGVAPDTGEAMDAAEEHRQSIDRWFYPCSHNQHCGLADMYLGDARFEKYWEDRHPGLARYVHDAIKANAARPV